MNVYSHRIKGETYLIKFTTKLPAGIDGTCSDPREPERIILIDSRLRGARLKSTILHEFRHAANWWSDETEVSHYSHDTAAFLSRPEIEDRFNL